MLMRKKTLMVLLTLEIGGSPNFSIEGNNTQLSLYPFVPFGDLVLYLVDRSFQLSPDSNEYVLDNDPY